MNAKWLVMVLGAAVITGCGEGRAIFNVDVYSFLKATDTDTVPYVGPLPPGVPDTIPVQQINSPGAGSSIVDTIGVSGSVTFDNRTGTGNVSFQVYFDTSASAVYTGTPALSVAGMVTPGAPTPSPFNIPNLPDAFKPFFVKTKFFVGIRASATATSGTVQGTARLTALQARVVIQEKIF